LFGGCPNGKKKHQIEKDGRLGVQWDDP